MKLIEITLFILSLMTLFWGIAGLVRPGLVLWWAVAEKQTKVRALIFACTLAFSLFCYAMIWLPGSPGWLWIPAILGLFALPIMFSSFRMTQEKEGELIKERQRSKRAALTRTSYSSTSDRQYEMRPFLALCSCPDWEKKRSQADGPFSVCKHLASHYACFPQEMPDELIPYKNIFLSFSCEGKGVPPEGKINGHGVIEGMAYLFTGYADSLPWVNVYTSYTGSERFGVNIETGTWAKRDEPPHSDNIFKKILEVQH